MKVALIFPFYSRKTRSSIPRLLQGKRGKYPPLGLAWVASSLERAGHSVRIIDAEAEELTNEEVVGRLESLSLIWLGRPLHYILFQPQGRLPRT